MRSRVLNPSDDDASWLGKEGVIVYPTYDLLRKEWYMEVDLSKRFPNKKNAIVTYKTKPIGTKMSLSGKDIREQWMATLGYWRKKIGDENRKNVQRPK